MDENAYEQGARRAWLSMLARCLNELGYDSPEMTASRWTVEREEAVQQLRGLCREFGDNDWDERLSLADVIDKHLGDHLRRMDEIECGTCGASAAVFGTRCRAGENGHIERLVKP